MVRSCGHIFHVGSSHRDGVARRVNMKTMREYVSWLYYQYLLITGIYVLEPWEKSIFNAVLFTMVAMVVYTSYVFVPIHMRLALEFFSGLARGHLERTVALMS
ncbi:serine palmitoyltransferase small subunit B-like [Triplophysa rosa]|uniref:serine palmitoyltransferase small subunit B-like n=1 Tax=Triplophysa rosa TaxID=992332 RepID=UPI00254605A1|nr:serine palmitoyltransferase small subunit B-like [Triplophysa rosa]